MENRINVAELLKDCPKGMELDCVTFDAKVTYQGLSKKTPTHPIIVQTEHGFELELTQYGQIHNIVGSKCVIFPKGKTTWEGFEPPCKFKDGDVISDSLGTCIFKGEGRIKGTIDYYCGVHDDYLIVKDYKYNPDGHYGYIVDYRFATEQEKEKLFKAIKENGYKWNGETKTLEKLAEPKFKVGDKVKDKNNRVWFVVQVSEKHFSISSVPNAEGYFVPIEDQDDYELLPNKFDITALKPFDKVLVRSCNYQTWTVGMFSFYSKENIHPFACVGGYVSQCIPYEENKHLLGTTDDCNEFYKTWK